MKNTLLLFLAIAPAIFIPSAFAQTEIIQTSTVNVKTRETSEFPQAVVISVRGKCETSRDGKTFTELKAGQVLNQGAIVRTGEEARSDLFFRRIGTTVRVQPGTVVTLESMTRTMQDGMPVMTTLLDLKAGRIFTVVRSLVPGSTFEIRNAAGRSVVEGGGGKGRYIITADGTQVTDKYSVVPLKVVGETGITVITPGQKFNAREGKVFSDTAPAAVDELIDLDEIQSLAEQLTPTLAPKAQDDSEALVLAVGPQSTVQNGSASKPLRVGEVLRQGAVIRSGDDTTIDLFLRRWGTTVRLLPNTELSLEKMAKNIVTDIPALETRLNLKNGRIFCFIRIPIPNSKFEVVTARGRSLIESAGAGRYDIRADGTIVAGKSSFRQIKVFTEQGVTMIEQGQKFSAENGQVAPLAPSDVELLMMQVDQLAALAEQLTAEEESAKAD